MIIVQVTWFNLWKNGPEHEQSQDQKFNLQVLKPDHFSRLQSLKNFFLKGMTKNDYF